MTAAAAAEPAMPAMGPRSDGRPWTGYVPVKQAVPVAKAASNIIYLNRCIAGCAIFPGFDNSRTDRSSIITDSVFIPPYAYGDESWDEVLRCVSAMYSPFDIVVTDVDPGETVQHFEAIVAGVPGDAGFPGYVGGVSPFSCGVIENAITYTFAEVWGDEPRTICETVAQETAHAFGLDHEFYCPDPMTYLTGCGNKEFRDVDAPCGEDGERQCQCGGATQNSYRRILREFGAGSPTPPEVAITTPRDGGKVTPSFRVVADITDNIEVRRAELWIDGALTQSLEIPPYIFNAPGNLAPGEHVVEVRAYDNVETTGSHIINVVQDQPCNSADQCSGGDTCVEGRCVTGPGTPGGLGEVCAGNEACHSGLCGEDGAGNQYCVESCVVGGNGCPCGFSCLAAGASGVCWPGGNDCGGGCAVTPAPRDASPLVPILIGFLAGAVFLFGRRSRRHA